MSGLTTYRAQSFLPHEAGTVFAWHARSGALERLIPPWQRVRVVERRGGVEDGARVVLELSLGPLRRRWIAIHEGHEQGRRFRDRQESGPFASWVHEHRFLPAPGGSVLEDEVAYALPGGALGAALGGAAVRRQLERLFAFRHARTRADLARHARHGAAPRLTILMSGASGLVGSALAAFLTTGGHEVRRLVRRASGPGEATWDPASGALDARALEGVDAVVHLAGSSIAAGRWTPARRAEILRSRVDGTTLLARAIAAAPRRPGVFVCASAIGWYGDRGDEPLTEDAAPGKGFLAEVCRAWEAATEPAEAAGVRVVKLRIGIVLAAAGGALARMLPPFRLGLGGPAGDGRQFMSWIALDDLVGALHHALFDGSLAGAVNATAPEPVRNAEFARTLGRVLHRPAFAPLPAAVVRTLFGEMGQALLLDGARVAPARLAGAGFTFLYPTLEEALRAELGSFR